MQQDFETAKNLIGPSRNILLTMHERMDGDDGGALLAFGNYLEKAGKKVTYAIKKGVPPHLSFLPGSENIVDDIAKDDAFDLLIAFGCSSLARCGSENIAALEIATINIDHHPDNSLFGTINLVDPKKSSVAELVYDFFLWAEWPLSQAAATCLLTGIITDTGCFMHANTTASALKAAANLMLKGAPINKIINRTFRHKPPHILKAWGRAMENSYFDRRHKIIYSVMTDEDLVDFKNLPQAAFEGFVETLNTVPEARFAMFLRQDGQVIKGSLRSDAFKNADVAKAAKIFGGGGHKLAAGFSLLGKLQKDQIGNWKII